MLMETKVLCSWDVTERHRDEGGEAGRGLISVNQGGNLDFILLKVKPLEYFRQWSGKVELTVLKY